MQRAMNTFSNRQEGGTIGMKWSVAPWTYDDGCEADDDAEQQDPESEEPAHDDWRCLHLKSDQQAGDVSNDDEPHKPATIANFCQTISQIDLFSFDFLAQRLLPSAKGILMTVWLIFTNQCTTSCKGGKPLACKTTHQVLFEKIYRCTERGDEKKSVIWVFLWTIPAAYW